VPHRLSAAAAGLRILLAASHGRWLDRLTFDFDDVSMFRADEGGVIV
jgi:hypothetical protein